MINNVELRLVHVYKEDENKFIEIVTNQLDGKHELLLICIRNVGIELFFKAIK